MPKGFPGQHNWDKLTRTCKDCGLKFRRAVSKGTLTLKGVTFTLPNGNEVKTAGACPVSCEECKKMVAPVSNS